VKSHSAFQLRSTKAGARTPATPSAGGSSSACRTCAQRRPGPEPRRHEPDRRGVHHMPPLAQRRPGPEPRRHGHVVDGRAAPEDRSTKAGARTPATHARGHQSERAAMALNEGRGPNPGDTEERAHLEEGGGHAQRRPGPEPRRHTFSPTAIAPPHSAQRRPGPEPRRHLGNQQPRVRSVTSLNEGRGPNPGDTLPSRPRGSASPRALNEGRGPNPGDTVPRPPPDEHVVHAQRRPGPEPRRHGQGARPPHGHDARSTKAGARTPATPAMMIAAVPRGITAQRRPGPEPRRHVDSLVLPADYATAQRRPGPEPRRHPTPGGSG